MQGILGFIWQRWNILEGSVEMIRSHPFPRNLHTWNSIYFSILPHETRSGSFQLELIQLLKSELYKGRRAHWYLTIACAARLKFNHLVVNCKKPVQLLPVPILQPQLNTRDRADTYLH